MNDKLYDLLLKLPKKNLLNLLWLALDVMQSYNGQSRTKAIVTAIGGEQKEAEGDLPERYVVPSLAKIKEITDYMGL